MTDLEYRHRPISSRNGFTGESSWAGNPFTASLDDTVRLLARELEQLRARHVIIEVDVPESKIRADGMLRADASTAGTTPAVRLVFDTPGGPLQFATDMYGWDYNGRPMAKGWHQNLRAIAKGLEALRSVKRYGIAQSGEQYTGYKQLTGPGSTMSQEQALHVLRAAAAVEDPAVGARTLYELAAKRVHPNSTWRDARPDTARWHDVQAAARRLHIGGMTDEA